MNLGVEYLVRTGAIKDLFETPCSLFLVNCKNARRLVVTLQDDVDGFFVQHWNVEDSDDFKMPEHVDYKICKDDVFRSDKVIIPEYHMMSYRDSYIPTCHNSFREPMSEHIYENSYKKTLNSQQNKWRREKWLWRCFFKRSRRSTPNDYDYALEQRYVKGLDNEDSWDQWQHWRYSLLCNRVKTATELIFLNEYEHVMRDMFKQVTSSFSSS